MIEEPFIPATRDVRDIDHWTGDQHFERLVRHDTVRTMHDEFADWYGALWPRVLRAVTISVGDRDLAEEATAEAFARALARWPGPAKLHSPAAWLHTVALNEVRSHWRRARLEHRVLERLGAQSQHHAVEPEPRDDTLWSAVAALPDRARRMVALRYVLDLPEAEIASMLGVTRGTVASTLSKARQQLNSVLAHSRSEPAPTAIREEMS
ncbi:MAG TPA: sigma-70 family RNA polymerase sigma factor [Jiangellaceae bacterium]